MKSTPPPPSVLHAPVNPEKLRDHASSRRVEAIWSRLEAGLPEGTVLQGKGPQSKGWRAFGPMLGIRVWALTVLAFGLGIVVGAGALNPKSAVAPTAEVLLHAEPRAVSGQGHAAPAGARVTGAPESSGGSGAGLRSRRGKQPALIADSALVTPTEPAVAAVAEPTSVPRWQLLAEQGEYELSGAALDEHGGFDSAIDHATAEQLMLLVDVARATGFRQRAVLALRRVVGQHGSDALAPLAAWSLGNMLEKAGDHQGAADAFAAYRTLSPQGDFAEDALAREIRMAVARADAPLANRLAAQYEQSFPNGRRADEIREQLHTVQSADTNAVGSWGVDAGAESAEAPLSAP